MKANNSIEKPGWTLIAKYLANETTVQEKHEVEKWANFSEQNKSELDQYKLLYDKAGELYEHKNFNTDNAWNKIQQHVQQPQTISTGRKINARQKSLNTFYKYAAVILVVLSILSAGIYLGIRGQNQGFRTEITSTENNAVKEFVLPDGSLVTLNSNSDLQFPKKFKSNVREVTLTGEAFFNVKRNPDKPFIINAGNTQVKVVGTSFNVNAYPEDKMVEIVVETGTVLVSPLTSNPLSDSEKLLLNSGEKGSVSSVGNLEKTLFKNPNYLAWKTRNLIFNKTPLNEVMHYLNKTYHVDIQLKESELNDLVLTAEFQEKSLDFILNVIQLTFGLELSSNNGRYILTEKKLTNK